MAHEFFSIFTQHTLKQQWSFAHTARPDKIQHGNLDNHHQSFGSWSIARFNASCPSLAGPNSRLACNSADQCLKLCNIICCNAPTLNNPQDLDPDCLAASFLVKWTLAHGSTGKWQCGVNGVSVLHPAEKGSCYSINSERAAVILAQVRYRSNTVFILAPDTNISLKFQTLTSWNAC